MGSKANKSGAAPKRRRRGRKLLFLGLIGLGVAAFKATREGSAPAPAPAAPAPRAATPPTPPTPPPAPVEPVAPVATVEPEIEEAIERLETESPAVPDVEPVSPTDDLHDIVEEPWADGEVTPVTEPPADSLTSFFDEVMTDTAERKLRNGQ